MQVQESATVSIEPGVTVGDLLLKLQRVDPSASWSSSCKLSLSFDWVRDETADEKTAREAVEQRQLDVKLARQALQEAQALQAAVSDASIKMQAKQ